jgi:hypothetical protein
VVSVVSDRNLPTASPIPWLGGPVRCARGGWCELGRKTRVCGAGTGEPEPNVCQFSPTAWTSATAKLDEAVVVTLGNLRPVPPDPAVAFIWP